jgi:hypothetical protein
MRPNTLRIGTYAFPVDNSWSINLLTGERAYLAGTISEPSNKVKIISLPYKEDIVHLGKTHTEEFVNVKYKRQRYRVLNDFHTTPPIHFYYEEEEYEQ